MTFYELLTPEETDQIREIETFRNCKVEELTFQELQALAYFWGITTVAAVEKLEGRILLKSETV